MGRVRGMNYDKCLPLITDILNSQYYSVDHMDCMSVEHLKGCLPVVVHQTFCIKFIHSIHTSKTLNHEHLQLIDTTHRFAFKLRDIHTENIQA